MKKKFKSRDHHPFWPTLRSLPSFGKKLEYVWDCYKIHIVILAFTAFFAISLGTSIYKNSAPTYLRGDFINVISSPYAEDYQPDYLKKAFLRDYLGLPEKDRTRFSYVSDLFLDSGDGSGNAAGINTNTLNVVDAHLAAGEVDFFLLSGGILELFEARYDVLLDLREFLTAQELNTYQDRLLYNREGIPVGISIADTDMVRYMGIGGKDGVYLAWCRFTGVPEHMRPFFDFVMQSAK